MLVIGLTGSFGTGKSTVAGMFQKCGARIIDADRIARWLIAPGGKCYSPVIKAFGKNILSGKRIDRKKLAGIVFNDEQKLKKLNRIIHPQVAQEIRKQLHSIRQKNALVVLDVPLLLEAGWRTMTDVLIVVKANRQKQVERAIKKRGFTRSEVLARIQAQMPIKEKIKMADAVIDNSGQLNTTQEQVEEICQRLHRRKQKTQLKEKAWKKQ